MKNKMKEKLKTVKEISNDIRMEFGIDHKMQKNNNNQR